MKRLLVMFLLVLGLVVASHAREDYSPQDYEDYSPQDYEDYSSQEADEQGAELDEMMQDLRGFIDDSMKYRKDAELDNGLQDVRGFSDESMEDLGDVQLDELQELQGIKEGFIKSPEDVSSFVRNKRGRGGNLRSSMRKVVKSVLGKKPKTQQEKNNEDENTMVESVFDDNLTYVTGRPLPAQDLMEPIPKTLAEKVLQIMRDINGVDYSFVIPMSVINCSSSYPTLGRHMPYSSSQLTIKMDAIVNTECSYRKSSSINKAVTTASVNFSMSPEPHFIITRIEVEPETEVDFRGSAGSKNNPLDSILARSGQFVKLYLEESVKDVFKSLKRSG